jgi:mannosyltransferase
MSQMDGIITTCSAANSYLETPADVVIPHGIDLERYHPPKDKKEAWQTLGFPGEFGIGIFGRVRPSKGIDVLVDAVIPVLKENSAPTVVIVGETTPKFRDYQKQLQAKIDKAGLSRRIIFHGKQPGRALPGLFRGMSIVAALSRNEGFGLTIPEAMASGCAVLASHAGAWQDIIDEGHHGFTVPVGDPEATQAALKKLLDSNLGSKWGAPDGNTWRKTTRSSAKPTHWWTSINRFSTRGVTTSDCLPFADRFRLPQDHGQDPERSDSW